MKKCTGKTAADDILQLSSIAAWVLLLGGHSIRALEAENQTNKASDIQQLVADVNCIIA